MTKSVLEIARNALAAGEVALPSYASRFSRHDDTQPPLFALLVLRQLLRTDYRGIVTLAGEWRELREALGLTKVPHYSTLAYAVSRLMAGAEKGGRSGAPKRRSWSARARRAWWTPLLWPPWMPPGSRHGT